MAQIDNPELLPFSLSLDLEVGQSLASSAVLSLYRFQKFVPRRDETSVNFGADIWARGHDRARSIGISWLRHMALASSDSPGRSGFRLSGCDNPV